MQGAAQLAVLKHARTLFLHPTGIYAVSLTVPNFLKLLFADVFSFASVALAIGELSEGLRG